MSAIVIGLVAISTVVLLTQIFCYVANRGK